MRKTENRLTKSIKSYINSDVKMELGVLFVKIGKAG